MKNEEPTEEDMQTLCDEIVFDDFARRYADALIYGIGVADSAPFYSPSILDMLVEDDGQEN